MRRWLEGLALLGGLVLLWGCAQGVSVRLPPVSPHLPELRLPPAQLEHEFSLVQRLSISRQDVPDAPPQVVDVQLELGRDGLRVAGFALGQRVLWMVWDGRDLSVQRHPRLPSEVDVSRILRDMTLVYWPAAAVRAALPSRWTLEEEGPQRRLLEAGVPRVTLSRHGGLGADSRIEVVNLAEHYRLLIESRPAGVGQ